MTTCTLSLTISTTLLFASAAATKHVTSRHDGDGSLPSPPSRIRGGPTKETVTTTAAGRSHLGGEMLFASQSLPAPYYGQNVGVAIADLNGDGAMDLLFAAGRHWVDQPFALVNLGTKEKYGDDGAAADVGEVLFSDPIPLGPPGAYYQIDVSPLVAPLTTAGTVRWSVLLVGGTCHLEEANDFGSCKRGENTAAKLLEVSVDGCSIDEPDVPCNAQWDAVWEDPSPSGDRNGGLVHFGSGYETDPSIVLLGQGGIHIYERQSRPSSVGDSNDGPTLRLSSAAGYSDEPSFFLPAPEKTDPRSDYGRYAGFAAGEVGSTIGGIVVAGRRSDFDLPVPDENKVLYKKEHTEDDAVPSEFAQLVSLGGGTYAGNSSYSLQSTNFAFADLNGDGIQDLVEATYLYPEQIEEGYPLPQRVHFLGIDDSDSPTVLTTEMTVLLESPLGGRSVATGRIFGDNALPDIAFASADGVVTLFANLGVDDDTGIHQGFEERNVLRTDDERCEIRDVAIVRGLLVDDPCSVSIVCAVACAFSDMDTRVLGANYVFHGKASIGRCVFEEESSAQGGNVARSSPVAYS